MTKQKETKLKTLFKLLYPNNVLTSALLDSNGVSRHLRRYYQQSGWIEPIGRGAYKKPGDTIEWQAGVNALYNQLGIKLHVGGLTALTLHGFSHYFRISKETLYLFSPLQTRLPQWFLDYDWKVDLFLKTTSFLPETTGIKELERKEIKVNVSTPERAILECLYLAPQQTDLVECYQVLEGLVNLKPKLLNELLIACNSIKVKRIFLYMAEKANHQWFQFLKLDSIDIGSGDRMITANGVYNSKYQITIPKELAEL
ncbi:MAG TPA: type IV toxin-antitoxin system AbiEi family antitoxin domain-containing protein [Bacteroidales bacterium]|nr:type IV toxin-antitoxin system AbiEi family antitoxin domain-containing protein [Bacteroidales bacterium]